MLKRLEKVITDAPRPRPNDKEVAESIHFVSRVTEALFSRGSPLYDVPSDRVVVIDAAGGHGLVAMTLTAMKRARFGLVLDPYRPPSFDGARDALVAAGMLRSERCVSYIEGSILPSKRGTTTASSNAFFRIAQGGGDERKEGGEERKEEEKEERRMEGDGASGLASSASGEDPSGPLDDLRSVVQRLRFSGLVPVCVSVHACGALADWLASECIALQVPFAVMGCCHGAAWSDSLPGFVRGRHDDRGRSGKTQPGGSGGGDKSDDDGQFNISVAASLARLGAIRAAGYKVRWREIPSSVSQMNIVLAAFPHGKVADCVVRAAERAAAREKRDLLEALDSDADPGSWCGRFGTFGWRGWDGDGAAGEWGDRYAQAYERVHREARRKVAPREGKAPTAACGKAALPDSSHARLPAISEWAAAHFDGRLGRSVRSTRKVPAGTAIASSSPFASGAIAMHAGMRGCNWCFRSASDARHASQARGEGLEPPRATLHKCTGCHAVVFCGRSCQRAAAKCGRHSKAVCSTLGSARRYLESARSRSPNPPTSLEVGLAIDLLRLIGTVPLSSPGAARAASSISDGPLASSSKMSIDDEIAGLRRAVAESDVIARAGEPEENILALFRDEIVPKLFDLENIASHSPLGPPEAIAALGAKLPIFCRHFAVGLSPGAGIAVSLQTSFLNHSCEPNAEAWIQPAVGDAGQSRLVISAMHDIDPLTPVTISYVPSTMIATDRRAMLRDMYDFSCRCGRCLRYRHEREWLEKLARSKSAQDLRDFDAPTIMQEHRAAGPTSEFPPFVDVFRAAVGCSASTACKDHNLALICPERFGVSTIRTGRNNGGDGGHHLKHQTHGSPLPQGEPAVVWSCLLCGKVSDELVCKQALAKPMAIMEQAMRFAHESLNGPSLHPSSPSREVMAIKAAIDRSSKMLRNRAHSAITVFRRNFLNQIGFMVNSVPRRGIDHPHLSEKDVLLLIQENDYGHRLEKASSTKYQVESIIADTETFEAGLFLTLSLEKQGSKKTDQNKRRMFDLIENLPTHTLPYTTANVVKYVRDNFEALLREPLFSSWKKMNE